MIRTLTPVFSILIAILLYFFFIDPMYIEVREIRSDTALYQQATADYDDFNTKINSKLALKTEQNPQNVERLNQFLPENVDSAQIIADLEKMAQSQNMLFGNITSESSNAGFKVEQTNSGNDQEVESAELQTVDITFSVIGTYKQFKDFLRTVESSLSLLEIINIEFIASQGFFEQFTLTVRSYALPKIID